MRIRLYLKGETNIEAAHHRQTTALRSESSSCSLFFERDFDIGPTATIVGEIDLVGAPRIFSQIWKASEKGSYSLVLNMEKLDFMDSSGLQIFLRLREKLKPKEQSLLLVGLKPQIQKLFRLTGFDKLFLIFDNLEDIEKYLAEGRGDKPDFTAPNP